MPGRAADAHDAGWALGDMDSGPHGGILKIAGTKTGGVKNLAECKKHKKGG